METSYPTAVQAVNTDAIPWRVLSFFVWLCKLSRKEGYCWASTPYMAQKQGVQERTIYRWLSLLKAQGLISVEVDKGIERRIVPLVEPPKRRKRTGDKLPPKSGVNQGELSGGIPLKDSSDALEASTQQQREPVAVTEPQPGVVAALEEIGVSRPVAVALVASKGEEPVKIQLQALPYRNAKDPAAVAVSSIRAAWPLPSALIQAQQRAQIEAQQAAKRAFLASQAQEGASRRSELLQALESLSAAEKASLEVNARNALLLELPAAGRLMLGRAPGQALIRDRMVKLMAQGV